MAHHASASGYDRLTHYIRANVIQPPSQPNFIYRSIGAVFRSFIKTSGLQWYNRSSLFTELAVSIQSLKQRGQIFHYLYGENQFRYYGALSALKNGNKTVCTYHTPEQRFFETVSSREFIRQADAIIIVSQVQRDLFRGYVADDRVFFVPHGIDVDIFSPAAKCESASNNTLRCIAVGSHMRDYTTLAAALRLLRDANPDIVFDIVARDEERSRFAEFSNVDFHCGISDDKLISLYRNADALVLPMFDATANNSVLEAMACGLAIISTDLPGIRDYVSDECALLIPVGDASGLADTILSLSMDRGKLDSMRQNSRAKALEFDWRRVAEMTLAVYDSVLATTKEAR